MSTNARVSDESRAAAQAYTDVARGLFTPPTSEHTIASNSFRKECLNRTSLVIYIEKNFTPKYG